MFRRYFCLQFRTKDNKASILVTCLWIIMVLSILGMSLAGLVFQEIKFTKSYQRMIFSLPLARIALKTIFYAIDEDKTAYDTFGELTKENRVDLCAGNSYRYYLVDKNDNIDQYDIVDEGALINLNLASKDVLKRLPGIDEDLAEKIVNSGLRPFNAINEVLMVEDMTRDKFLMFKDLVTVYGTGKININTASKAVLLALGLDEELTDAIILFRQEHKIEVEKTPEQLAKEEEAKTPVEVEYGFSNVGKILEDLKSCNSLGLRQEQDILALLSVFDVKSDYLRFNVIPYSGNTAGLRYSIVIHPASKKILSWNEY